MPPGPRVRHHARVTTTRPTTSGPQPATPDRAGPLVVVGDGHLARTVCAGLAARGRAVLHLGAPDDATLRTAMGAPAADGRPDPAGAGRLCSGVAVLLHDDHAALRWTLAAAHVDPGVPLVSSVFDATVAASCAGCSRARASRRRATSSPPRWPDRASAAASSRRARGRSTTPAAGAAAAAPSCGARVTGSSPRSGPRPAPSAGPRPAGGSPASCDRTTPAAGSCSAGSPGSSPCCSPTGPTWRPGCTTGSRCPCSTPPGSSRPSARPPRPRTTAPTSSASPSRSSSRSSSPPPSPPASSSGSSGTGSSGSVGRRTLPRRGHVVVVGLGQVGLRLCQELRGLGLPVVAVERSADAPAVRIARRQRIPVLIADGQDRAVLERLALGRARALAAVGSDDLDNVAVAVAAQAVAPDVRVVLRAASTRRSPRRARSCRSGRPATSRPPPAPGSSRRSSASSRAGSSRRPAARGSTCTGRAGRAGRRRSRDAAPTPSTA